ncbi:MAG: YceI family protein [Rhizobacter sp.]|jgi:polyisoprenoid-binding protein YceI
MKPLILFALAIASSVAAAAPVSYTLDPTHTYPSFEADHMGVSVWRGKFNRSSGHAVMDRAAGTGQVEVAVEIDSIDFGLDVMNAEARKPSIFDAAKYPTATYKGRLEGFAQGVPSQVVGELTLHGVTRPLTLSVNRFKCVPHPMLKRELCGADLLGRFMRDDFGIDAGKPYGFAMEVTLRVQVEAIANE